MRQQRKQLLRAFVISLVLVVAFIVIGSRVPMLSRLYIIAAPGWFGASLLLPRSGYSGLASLGVYLAIAVIIDALLYTWPVLITWRFLSVFSK
jgi:hypothetical protein